ncbi:hypothetical protein [Salinigranum sp.]|uniref:hypothetical protein n=1 Tax=Salinigranum sp. TaxID=1966351 RepID=UPI0035695BFA
MLVLETGVQSVFGDRDVVDEGKFDGFDVRIVDVDGPLAFTRSGYVCPYTTVRPRALLDHLRSH